METLNTLIQSALENDVDFEVWHGTTTHADKRVRSNMKVELAGAPAVIVLFGDKKHEQRFSSAHLSENKNIPVKLEHLLKAMQENKTENHWRRDPEKTEPIFLNLKGTSEHVRLTGEFSEDLSTFTARNFFYSENYGLHESEQTVYRVVIPEGPEQPLSAKQTTITGTYMFPDIIVLDNVPRYCSSGS